MDQDLFDLIHSQNDPFPMDDMSIDHRNNDPDVLSLDDSLGHPRWSDPSLTHPQTNGYLDEPTTGFTNTASSFEVVHSSTSQPAFAHNCVNGQPAAQYPSNSGSASGSTALHHSQSVPSHVCFDTMLGGATPLGQTTQMNHFAAPQAHFSQPMDIVGNPSVGMVNAAHQNHSPHGQLSSSFPHCSPQGAAAMTNGFNNMHGSPHEPLLRHHNISPPAPLSMPITSGEGTTPPSGDSTGTSPGTQGNARVGNQKKSDDKKGGLWIFTVFWTLLRTKDIRIKWISKQHFIFQVEENQTEGISQEWAKGGYVATWGNFTRAIRESIAKEEGYLVKIPKGNPPCVIPKNRVFQFGNKARERICKEDPEFQAFAPTTVAAAEQVSNEPRHPAPPQSVSTPSLPPLSPWNVDFQDKS